MKRIVYRFVVISILMFFAAEKTEAQNLDVFEDEVSVTNGLTYYQDQPLTGTVFSIDDIEIPNQCQCTHKTLYSNGKKNGIEQQWFSNGTLKQEGNFKNGLPVGIHTSYDKKGNTIQKETYVNEEEKTITFYNKGTKTKKEYYKQGIKRRIQFFENNILINEELINGNKTKKVSYYQSGNIKKESFYKNRKKEGTFKEYNQDKSLKKEEEYHDDFLIGGGSYVNNQKDGEWFRLSKDHKIKTIETYNNGKLIDTKRINSAEFIKNFTFKDNDKVVSYYNALTDETLYYVLRFVGAKTGQHNKQIANKLKNSIGKRAKIHEHYKQIENKSLEAVISIENISSEEKKVKYSYKKTVNGVEKTFYENAYENIIKYDITIYDLEHNPLDNYSYTINPQDNLGTSLFNSLTTNYAKTPDVAFNRSYKKINASDFLVNYFPIVTHIAMIKDSNKTKVKKLEIDTGSQNDVRVKMYFNVYNPRQTQVKAKIRTTKVSEYSSICKVLEGGNWLKEQALESTELLLIETKK